MAPRPLAPAADRPLNVPLLAVAGAVTVANIYFPQPLLAAVAHGLDVSERTAGLIASAAQIGYALGILLLVPLADSARLRRLTSVLLALTSAALLVAAAAPDVLTLTLATLALSTTTVLPQILTPVAAVLAGPGRQGRVVGLVGLGLTLGYGPGAAGLFGLLTLPAALLSAAAGPLADRYGASAVNAGGLGCAGLGLALAGLAPSSPAALVAGANLLVVGVSSCQVANQARIFGIGRAVAARVNTVFMLATFAGGALGSLAGSWLYGAHGWRAALLAAGACVAAAGLAVVAAARPVVPSCVRDTTREAGGIRPRIPQGES
ncbi:MFS transporter [Streptomyces sp. NPDC004285]